MPVYTVVHRTQLDAKSKEKLASEFTDLHYTVTDTPRDAVKVYFFYLDSDSFFRGGRRVEHFVRVSAQIRVGRSDEQKNRLLLGMYQSTRKALDALGAGEDDAEIQTQITEIDDRLTVMTNGILNT